MRTNAIVLFCGTIFFISCGQNTGTGSRGAIVLNDSSGIVTETDSAYLQDMVADITPPPVVRQAIADTAQAEKKDTVATGGEGAIVAAPAEPTNVPPVTAAPANMSGTGMKVTLKELTVFIPGIQTRSFGRQSDNSAAVQLQSGSLEHKKIQTSGLAIQQVNQRYTSVVVLKTDDGELELSELTKSAGWEKLNGSNNTYQVAGGNTIKHATPTPQQIRNAVSRAMSKKHLNKKKQQDILASIKNRNTVEAAPFDIKMKNVVWQFEYKNEKGRTVRKELRIDIPM